MCWVHSTSSSTSVPDCLSPWASSIQVTGPATSQPGSEYGYALLWVVTLSTIMLIALQHNVAHLGIVTGLCLSEAAVKYTPSWVGRPIVASAVLASVSTSLAEILGGAIALQMLFGISIPAGGSIGHHDCTDSAFHQLL